LTLEAPHALYDGSLSPGVVGPVLIRSSPPFLMCDEDSLDVGDELRLLVEKQTDIQERLRIDGAQPYAWAEVRPDDAEPCG